MSTQEKVTARYQKHQPYMVKMGTAEKLLKAIEDRFNPVQEPELISGVDEYDEYIDMQLEGRAQVGQEE